MIPVSSSNDWREFFAGGLLLGGLFLGSMPWWISNFAEPESQPTPEVSVPLVMDQPRVSLPETNLAGPQAIQADLALLRDGLRRLEQTSDYTGTFRKQERIDGIMDEGSLIEVTGRHQPLSLYLKWLEGDRGRELLFVEDQNDGEMLVRLGGLRGRFLPAIKLNPDGETARQEARHHISHVSILNLTKHVIEHRLADLKKLSGLTCQLIVDREDEKPSILVSTEYNSPQVSPEYRKTMHVIDGESRLPLQIKTYGWPEAGQEISAEELDAATLLEHYEYSKLQFDNDLTDQAFSRDNPSYSFGRRRS